ncbi:MAG: SUMF1/EgtB/PvdO family nonheme iron enzyme [Phycisphaerae bacterium]
MIGGLLLAGASGARADDHADARFRGTGKADPVRIASVRCSDGPAAGQSSITFDLAWDHSWRAAWEVGEQQHGGKGTLKLESWDAAWVFAKFRKRGDNGWSHATLSAKKADHRVPPGVTLEVGLTDQGQRGVGVFAYRRTVGHGPNDFKGVTLRWLHGADAAGAVDLKVFALQMVYVPSCAFWAGDGSTDHVAGQFSAGYSVKPFRVESERALTVGGETAQMLNNRDAAGMALSLTDDFNSDLPRMLSGKFPKGYQAFYSMRHELTQQQYVDFLNTLSYAGQCRRTERQGKDKKDMKGPEAPAGTLVMKPLGSEGHLSGGQYRSGIKIAVSGVARVSEPVVIQRGSFVASGNIVKPGKPAVYETDAPHVACNFITHLDGSAFAAWAGLRPMTELEFEKACRGPLKPVPNEYAWGTAAIAGMDSKGGHYALQNPGRPDETVVWTGENGPDVTRGNAPSMGTNQKLGGPLRVGIFATPTSDRVSSGASYWGIQDLTGNVVERAVSVGHPAGRAFLGNHGDGGDSPWADLFFGMRGGGYGSGSHYIGWGGNEIFRTSNRFAASVLGLYGGSRHFTQGFRCVRTAPGAKSE